MAYRLRSDNLFHWTALSATWKLINLLANSWPPSDCLQRASDSTCTQYCRRSALYELLCMYVCMYVLWPMTHVTHPKLWPIWSTDLLTHWLISCSYALQRGILLRLENPTHRYWAPVAAARRCFKMVLFTASRGNTFVGGTWALTSALLVCYLSFLLLRFYNVEILRS